MAHLDIGNHMLESLGRQYVLKKNDIGSDARLSAKGIRLNTESYEVEGLGHLCILRMHALFGIAEMETVVLTAVSRDVPLFNVDKMKVFANETLMAELFDTQLGEWPRSSAEAFQAIREKAADLPDYRSAGHWYDAILLPCSCSKKARASSRRLSEIADDYIDVYVSQLQDAEICSAEEKSAKTRTFAERLISEGGPAVDTIVKLFGEQTAYRMIRKHMYGI